MNPQAKLLWEQIRNPNCTECPLHEDAQTVCLIGDGPVPAKIMIVGEAPGFREDEVSRPFQGRSGKLLDATLDKVGLSRDDIFITNACKCRPPENRTPSKSEVKICRQLYFEDELAHVKPDFILLCGNTALNIIKKSGIMKHRGEVYQLDGATVLPTVHPAAVLRNPRYEDLWRTDLQTFARMVKGMPARTSVPRTILVRNGKALEVLIRAILTAEAVAYDLETTGFAEWADDAEVITIAVSTTPGLSFVVPIMHPEAHWRDPSRVLRIVGNALVFTDAKRVAHNAKFDDRWLHAHAAPTYADFDTMIAAHALDENQYKGLKVLAPMYLGVEPWKDVDLGKGGAKTTSLAKLARYNAKDADYTLRLYYHFRQELTSSENARTLRLYSKLLMPASRTLTDVEKHGMWVDQNRLATRRIEVTKKLEDINRNLTKAAGVEVNWNSPAQLGEIMFGKLGLPLIEMTAKGAASTKESVLLQLRHEYPFAAELLEWRKWSKYHSTYLEGWSVQLDRNGRLHPNYKITGTVTGRLSSGKDEGSRGPGLNVQQVPRDAFIRSIIGAPPGWRFVEADFSQIELRVAAHYSGDPTLLRLFQLGEDPHMTMAMQLTGKPAHLVTKEERKKAKGVNFGYLFGMGFRKFVDYARDSYDLVVSEDEAKASRDRFFETFSSLHSWHQRQRRLVSKYHRVQSLIGRVRHLPDVVSEDEDVRAEAQRQAINSPVQSLASDMSLMAMIMLHEKMDPNEARVVGTVHDSILFEIREEALVRWLPIIRDTMEHLPLKRKFGVQLSVPIKVDITVGQHWSEGEEWAS